MDAETFLDDVRHEPVNSPPPSEPPRTQEREGEEGETVVDPGGRLQDIADPELRTAVARMRGRKGAQSARASRAQRGAQGGEGEQAGSGSVALDGPPPLDISILDDIIDGRIKANASDRIRAVEARARLQGVQAGEVGPHAELLALRDALSLLTPEERERALRDALGLDGHEGMDEEEGDAPMHARAVTRDEEGGATPPRGRDSYSVTLREPTPPKT